LAGTVANLLTGADADLLDTDGVSVGAFVQHVGRALWRAHALFGDPPGSGAPAAVTARTRLGGAGNLVRQAGGRVGAMSGSFPASYGTFRGWASPSLDEMAGADGSLGNALSDAAATDRSGRGLSGAVVGGAAADTAVLGPWSGTAAGQRVLMARLRARLVQQQQVIAAYRARDARLAGLLRSMAYRSRPGSPGRMPFSPNGFGATSARGASPLAGPSGLSSLPSAATLAREARDRNSQRIRSAARHDSRDVPAGPAGAAVAAALTRRGAPYVWGAKGPSSFDCSGLTQWAWRQAGVQLGGDTYTQIGQGVPVRPGEVRAGDLIFPTDSFGNFGPGHVQLAISASEVIHAPQSGDVVREAPMPNAYVARRPVPSQ
jgi:cell wall-associated NlpC family hydrolase